MSLKTFCSKNASTEEMSQTQVMNFPRFKCEVEVLVNESKLIPRRPNKLNNDIINFLLILLEISYT